MLVEKCHDCFYSSNTLRKQVINKINPTKTGQKKIHPKKGSPIEADCPEGSIYNLLPLTRIKML